MHALKKTDFVFRECRNDECIKRIADKLTKGNYENNVNVESETIQSLKCPLNLLRNVPVFWTEKFFSFPGNLKLSPNQDRELISK